MDKDRFLQHNFDKLLLVFVFLVLGVLLIYFAFHADDKNQMTILIITGIMSMVSATVGAITALATGGLMARRNGLDKPDPPESQVPNGGNS